MIGKNRGRREEKKIEKSEYNRWYGEIKGEGIPEYLKKGWRENRWRRIARFRLGSEIRENRYWEKEENKLCKMCGGEVESWEYVWEGCREWTEERKSWQEMIGVILGGEGEGEWWMREVERERSEREAREEGREKVEKERVRK